MNLGVINYPDSLGAACDYQPFSFYLGGKRTYYGLPNNPNYQLGPVVGSACDTLNSSVEEIKEKNASILINPNPATHVIFCNAKNIKGKNAFIKIINALGVVVYQRKLNIFSGGFAAQTIEVSSLQSGLYILFIQSEKEVIKVQFMKE